MTEGNKKYKSLYFDDKLMCYVTQSLETSELWK